MMFIPHPSPCGGAMATPKLASDPMVSSPAVDTRARPRPFARRFDKALPFLLLTPSALFLIIFIALPMVQALVLAVQNPQGEWTLQYVQRMVRDVNFTDALRNTFLLILFAIPL